VQIVESRAAIAGLGLRPAIPDGIFAIDLND
jgi:hypothetical protein